MHHADPRAPFAAASGRRRRGPRLVSAQANLNYLPSGDRRRLVFASENESDGPGLYVASARP